ncbi:HAMP domain-containing histidine kinase [Enterococcus sp. 669A]|uniref:histidine kinase n=1 Tax=Candidatus Enterococcus moelleringii TaxID=2815325 RepID=A0ABS3L7H0_9ENTE|nr:HAMP domain-containing sensor histidine kinase [Enterococcus sp. 669A]MBO1305574.1 HAMP domain-containing histidine kinase [Enterococcus sp. 669A]
MAAAKRFFRKYLFSSFLILISFLLINAALLLAVLLFSWHSSTDPDIPVAQIADHIHTNQQGTVSADEKTSELLKENAAWGMVLNDEGTVVWEEAMPSNLPRQYSATEVAQFSRWYLDNYPVLVQETASGLLVIGCPPNSIVKYNFVTDTAYVRSALTGLLTVVVCNVTLMLLLFWYNTRKVEKAVTPILNGIETISRGKAVALAEKGELAAINAEVNRAGNYILKKDQARTEWIAGISHDIRTPLSIMLGYAGEIEDDDALPTETRTQATLIRQKGEKLRQLITDLNLTSKLEYAMQPFHLETIYPVELARQVITEYLNNGVDQNYSFELQADEKAHAIFFQGDAALLTRLLDNLIGNAMNHNPNGCHILVSVTKQENACCLSVIDDGVGMSQAQIDTLNDGIFPKQFNTQDSEGAHGLGLRLSSQIVQAHHGEIIFEPQSPNGLAVSVLIPVSANN